MSDQNRAHAVQVARIARLLDVAPAEVQGLDDVPVEDLRTLHGQVAEALFGDAQEGFAKIAGLARLMPVALTARLAERFVSPAMAARVCESMDAETGGALVARLSCRYMADVAVLLDPVRSRPVVHAMTPERVGEVSAELYRRGEYGVNAELAAAVAPAALAAAIAAARPRDLLAVAPLLEWTPALDDVVAALPVDQAREIAAELDDAELAELARAVGPSRMGPVTEHLDEARRGRLTTVLAEPTD